MFLLLVGPKGSGKSHIGRILERCLGVKFFHVEPHWMNYHAECQARSLEPSIPEGISRIHPQIANALRTNQHVCAETTGASPEILEDLLSLWQPSRTVVVRVSAALDVCLERIAARDATSQIPLDGDSIRRVYSLSVTADLHPQFTLHNTTLSDVEIVAAFEPVLARNWSLTPVGE